MEEEKHRTSGARILVVDDDEGLRDLIARTLGRRGYAVHGAARGGEAVERAATEPPGLILLDYRLPDMKGQDVVAALKERGLALPFVVMTGQGDERLAVELMKLGAAEYLVKDTDLVDRLPNVVERVLREVEVKARLSEAERSLRRAAKVFSSSRQGILITDGEARILDVNPAFSDITGFSREEVLGLTPRILQSGRHSQGFYTALWEELRATGHWSGEVWNRCKEGQEIAVLLTISSVVDEVGQLQNYIGLFSDITALKEYQAQLERSAHYDDLTGLPNRLLLADRLRQAMSLVSRREQRLVVAFLDLDDFKSVNDHHGHGVGDQLLAVLARRWSRVLRRCDTLARLGGDEFVAVLVDLPDIDASLPILTRLLEAAAQPVPLGDAVLRISASVGVTSYPQSAEVDADQLLRQADQAMYQAKQTGKNRFHLFDAEQDRSVRDHHELLGQMRRALGAGEFELYYQPKVNMGSGELVGAEALIRWNHPQRGLLSPGAFLSVLEDHPLSIDVGEWVLDTALSQVETWHTRGLSLPVSVNVGARQLQHPDFVPHLRGLLSRHPGVRAGELELEILETSALEDFPRVSRVMASCRELGVDFALDDFGTGYSSLLYLKQLPVSLIKLDQSFVCNMHDNADDLAILEGVLGLATAFRRRLMAEGVETVAQGELLLRMGCEWAQGYAIARPLPARDFQRWADSWEVPSEWKACKPIRRDLLPILFAAVDHRAWVAAMAAYLEGRSDTPPEAGLPCCRMGQWLDRAVRALLAETGSDRPVDSLHEAIHHLADELVALRWAGRGEEARDRLGELFGLRDRMLERLKERYAPGDPTEDEAAANRR